jgi:hypothetical protein
LLCKEGISLAFWWITMNVDGVIFRCFGLDWPNGSWYIGGWMLWWVVIYVEILGNSIVWPIGCFDYILGLDIYIYIYEFVLGREFMIMWNGWYGVIYSGWKVSWWGKLLRVIVKCEANVWSLGVIGMGGWKKE